MEAKELRIGNYVHAFKTVWQVDNTCFSNIELMETYQPIPLTEEWLVKMNFPENENTMNLFNNYGVYFQRLDNKLYLMSEDGGKRHIEFVHTAQNIHHALKGEDLVLKE